MPYHPYFKEDGHASLLILRAAFLVRGLRCAAEQQYRHHRRDRRGGLREADGRPPVRHAGAGAGQRHAGGLPPAQRRAARRAARRLQPGRHRGAAHVLRGIQGAARRARRSLPRQGTTGRSRHHEEPAQSGAARAEDDSELQAQSHRVRGAGGQCALHALHAELRAEGNSGSSRSPGAWKNSRRSSSRRKPT